MDIPASEFKPTIFKWLPDELEVTVYIRSFKDCVFSLLSNKKNSVEGNFPFPHPENPYLTESPSSNTDNISELHHGIWWTETWKKRCDITIKETLVPIILYIDGVATDMNGRLGVIPLNMTLGIFNSSTITKKDAWTTIYYHPDNESESAYH